MIYGCPIWLFFQFRNQKYVVHACEGKEFKIICKQFICKDLSGFLVRTLKQREHFVAGFIGIQFFITVYNMAIRVVEFLSGRGTKLERFLIARLARRDPRNHFVFSAFFMFHLLIFSVFRHVEVCISSSFSIRQV